eukprot:c52287_g1_i1 orf=227-469(+)
MLRIGKITFCCYHFPSSNGAFLYAFLLLLPLFSALFSVTSLLLTLFSVASLLLPLSSVASFLLPSSIVASLLMSLLFYSC